MSKTTKMSPLGWAETILHQLKSLQADVAKLTKEVADLRTEVRALTRTVAPQSRHGEGR